MHGAMIKKKLEDIKDMTIKQRHEYREDQEAVVKHLETIMLILRDFESRPLDEVGLDMNQELQSTKN